MNVEQKQDIERIFDGWKGKGNLDYVACWYKKATDLMMGTQIRTALVSTNSITQGEQVSILWKPLFANGVHIDFAHRTFRWDSEANIIAHVHCVIVGFSIAPYAHAKFLYADDKVQIVDNVNAYLLNADNVFIESRSCSICNVPQMVFGSMPNDGGYLSNYSDSEKEEIISKYPQAAPLFRKLVGADEFINGRSRWCLWLKDVSPSIIQSIPPVKEAIKKVRELRLKSNRAGTRALADFPMLFGEIRQPEIGDYIMVPRVSSEKRKYIPIGFMKGDIIASDAVQIIPGATLYHFGVLTSNVHMAWMRAVAGRLEMRYRYSKDIVYNNFPWPSPTAEQKAKIERTAQAILDARAKYPECSLADLYDENTMPVELRKAHQENDKAVMQAYGFWGNINTESGCVAALMTMYKQLTQK